MNYIGTILLLLAVVNGQTVFDLLNQTETSQIFNWVNTDPTAAGIKTYLSNSSSRITLFAPINSAISGLTPTPAFVIYHVIDGAIVYSSAVSNDLVAVSLSGVDLRLNIYNGKAFLNGLPLVTLDINATNGVIHTLNGRLFSSPDFANTIYQTLVANSNYTIGGVSDVQQLGTLGSAVSANGLTAALNSTNTSDKSAQLTLFAPRDAAFAALNITNVSGLAPVLLHHVVDSTFFSSAFTSTVSGVGPAYFPIRPKSNERIYVKVFNSTVSVGYPGAFANVVSANRISKNGVVHVIDNVLLPRSNLPKTSEYLASTGRFKVLLALVSGLNLVAAVDTPNSTVFAPNDSAFALLNINEAAVPILLANSSAQLTPVVSFHVVAGQELPSFSLYNDLVVIPALASSYLRINTASTPTIASTFSLAGSQSVVITPDLFTSTGVIHEVSQVIPVPDAAANQTIAETLVTLNTTASGDFGTLLSLLVQASLVAPFTDTTFDKTKQFTVFAPTNAAFAKLHPFAVDSLLQAANADLATVLTYHVIAGTYFSTGIPIGSNTLKALSNENIVVERTSVSTTTGFTDSVQVAGVAVSGANIARRNGVIHKIESVLLPPSLLTSPLITALRTTGSHNVVADLLSLYLNVSTLNYDDVWSVKLQSFISAVNKKPYTFFGPTDQAISALGLTATDITNLYNNGTLAAILGSHILELNASSSILSNDLVVQTFSSSSQSVAGNNWLRFNRYGSTWFINGKARITATDIAFANGLVHSIDSVLFPLPATANSTIAATVVVTPFLSTLLDFLTSAGLVPTFTDGSFNTSTTFTVFAPTNEAFGLLPSSLTAGLQANLNVLAEVLKYHVVASSFFSSAFAVGTTTNATTLQGSQLTIVSNTTGVFVNGVPVTTADIQTRNGVVHVISGVLTYPGFVAPTVPEPATTTTTTTTTSASAAFIFQFVALFLALSISIFA